MTLPKCAVLMATYNGEKYLKQQITSVLNQKDVEPTIFISDDNSTDKTLEVARQFSSQNVQLLCKEKKGSASKNFLSFFSEKHIKELEKYEYFAFCDQDDIWYETHITDSIKIIEQNIVHLVGANVITFGKNSSSKLLKYDQKKTLYDHLFQGYSPGCTFVFSKVIFNDFYISIKKSKDIDVEYHDWLLYAFAREKSYETYIKTTPSLKYRQHSQNHTGSRITISGKLWRLKKIFNSDYKKMIIKNAYALKLILNKENSITKLAENRLPFFYILKLIFLSRRIVKERILSIIPIFQILLRHDIDYK